MILTTAEWALAISLGSAAISAASLAWNIRSKFIDVKPRVRVGFYVATLFDGTDRRPNFLHLTGTNLGPGPVTITSAEIKGRAHLLGKMHFALINPSVSPYQLETSGGPFTGLPQKLQSGDQASLVFIWSPRSFMALAGVRVGLRDSYGRLHWVPRAAVRKAREQFASTFPDAKPLRWGEPVPRDDTDRDGT